MPSRPLLVRVLAGVGPGPVPLHRKGPEGSSADTGLVPSPSAKNDPIGLCSAEPANADYKGMKNKHRHSSCPTCGTPGLLRVSLTMEDGAVSYWTCAECETSGWQRGDGMVSREAALAHIPRR